MEDNQLIRDKWPELRTKIQREHPELSDEDLRYEIGKEGELLERLAAKLEKNRKEIFNWLALMG